MNLTLHSKHLNDDEVTMKRMRHVIDKLLEDDLTPAMVLKGLRLEKKMSQDDLAEVTGLKRTAISALENDRMGMTAHYADIFAIVFSVRPEEILYPNGYIRKSKELIEIEERASDFFKKMAAG